MEKEEKLLYNRFVELSRFAFDRNRVFFTDFLNLNDLQILFSIPKKDLFSDYCVFGGTDFAERKMAAFYLYGEKAEDSFPISTLKISPAKNEFAELPGHRDYLGAILNLGLEREKIGDIFVTEDGAVVYASTAIVSFLCDNLVRVRKTPVETTLLPEGEFYYEPRYEKIARSMASVRLDSLICAAFSLARSRAAEYIESGNTFINGKRITSNGCHPKEGDMVSVRGLGRFSFRGITGKSKKDRDFVELWKYV